MLILIPLCSGIVATAGVGSYVVGVFNLEVKLKW